MNEEFLVEPSAFNNAMELKYLLEKFGFNQGRFIGKFPKPWIKGIHQQLNSLPDIEQARVRSILDKNKNCLVPSGQEFKPTLSWIKNAHQQIEQKNFSGVIAAKPNQWGYPIAEDIDNDYLLGGHDTRKLGQAQQYTNIARRLLQLSHEIVLVDPYLDLNKPACEKVIDSFLKIAQQDKCRSLVIWAREEKAGMKGYQQMLERKYESKLAKGSQLRVKLVNDNNSAEKIHARLMLSILGGFRFDQGFAEFPDDRYVDISILDKKTHDHHCRWYLDPNSPNDFETVEEYVLSN
jgi:hypothetical protein